MNPTLLRRCVSSGLLLALAGGAVIAQSQSGRYDSDNLGSIRQSPAAEHSDDAAYDVGMYPSYPPELAAGDGMKETTSFCSMCHSTRYITMQPPLPAGTWDAEVTKMIKAYGAPIPDAPANKIRLYLQQHYTPETRK